MLRVLNSTKNAVFLPFWYLKSDNDERNKRPGQLPGKNEKCRPYVVWEKCIDLATLIRVLPFPISCLQSMTISVITGACCRHQNSAHIA